MSKYAISYENHTIKHELTFRNEKFDYTMAQNPETGFWTSDKKVFEHQLTERFDDLTVEQLEPIIDCVTDRFDDDEVFEGLKELNALE